MVNDQYFGQHQLQILYCVDSSDPMMIGSATISLIQLLHHPALQVLVGGYTSKQFEQ